MGDDLVAATFHHHLDRAVTVHLASALRVQDSDASTTSESLIRRALPRMRPDQLTKPHEESGLIAQPRASRARLRRGDGVDRQVGASPFRKAVLETAGGTAAATQETDSLVG